MGSRLDGLSAWSTSFQQDLTAPQIECHLLVQQSLRTLKNVGHGSGVIQLIMCSPCATAIAADDLPVTQAAAVVLPLTQATAVAPPRSPNGRGAVEQPPETDF